LNVNKIKAQQIDDSIIYNKIDYFPPFKMDVQMPVYKIMMNDQ